MRPVASRVSFLRTIATSLAYVVATCLGVWPLPLAFGEAPTPQVRTPQSAEPVRLIFDTDIGNDVDDVLALGVIHSLQSRGKCELLAVTITKDSPLAAPFVDAVNTFYGRGAVPIGVVREGKTPDQGKFIGLSDVRDEGRLRYPRDLEPGSVEDALPLLRRLLAAEPDGTVVIAQVGFSTNLARLLDSPPDDITPLSGRELVTRKVKLLSVMAGAFTKIPDDKGKPTDHREYNVVEDLSSARRLAEGWPTPIVWSGFEIGLSIPYPSQSILRDYGYVEHHPLAEAYHLYTPPPHDRPTWDLTSVLYAVLPDAGYFGLSPQGKVVVTEDGLTNFNEESGGRDRYLIVSPEQRVRVTEALVQLSSQPPAAVAGR